MHLKKIYKYFLIFNLKLKSIKLITANTIKQVWKITFLKAFETVYNTTYSNFLIFYFLNILTTTRKKYLQEKFWSNKEKQAWAKSWAWKHEGNVSTYKGFYIPIQLPQTEQAKFFQKKWDLDEQQLRDLQLAKQTFKFSLKTIDNTLNLQNIEKERSEKFWNKQIHLMNLGTADTITSKSQKSILYRQPIFKSFRLRKYWKFIKVTKFTFKKSFKKFSFRMWFSKKFLWNPLPYIFNLTTSFHTWSFLNLGFSTSEFLSFFFISTFPPYLVSFNFLKIKVLLFKKLKSYFPLYPISWTILMKPTFLIFQTMLLTRKFTKVSFTTHTLNNFFFFQSFIKIGLLTFFSKLFLKILLFPCFFRINSKKILWSYKFYKVFFFI